MHSLAQKRFLAKKDGKDEVVLTMEEAEATLAQISAMDLQVCKYMEYVPEDVLKAEQEEMFGDRDEWSSD